MVGGKAWEGAGWPGTCGSVCQGEASPEGGPDWALPATGGGAQVKPGGSWRRHLHVSDEKPDLREAVT